MEGKESDLMRIARRVTDYDIREFAALVVICMCVFALLHVGG